MSTTFNNVSNEVNGSAAQVSGSTGDGRRRNRWGPSRRGDTDEQQQQAQGAVPVVPLPIPALVGGLAQHRPVAEPVAAIIEPYISESEALEALVASATSRRELGNKEQQSSRPTVNDNNGRGQKRGRHEENIWGKVDASSHSELQPTAANDQPQPSGKEGTNVAATTATKEPVEKANFGLSGALAKDESTGRLYNGVLLKFSEPIEARIPLTRWRLYVFRRCQSDSALNQSSDTQPQQQQQQVNDKEEINKNGHLLEVLHIHRQSAYLIGRDERIADILVQHSSLSKQHCVIQYRALPSSSTSIPNHNNNTTKKISCKPYIMDLQSTNGTFINNVQIDDSRYYELRRGDVITLGHSSREYVLLTENTTST